MSKRIMDVEEANIKEKFAERYKSLLGKEYDTFIEYSLTFPRRSLRVNTIKISISELKKRLEKRWELTQIPWCKEGFWIKHIKGERRDIGNLIEHQLGYFHVQESASMIPPLVLDPKPNELILEKQNLQKKVRLKKNHKKTKKVFKILLRKTRKK